MNGNRNMPIQTQMDTPVAEDTSLYNYYTVGSTLRFNTVRAGFRRNHLTVELSMPSAFSNVKQTLRRATCAQHVISCT